MGFFDEIQTRLLQQVNDGIAQQKQNIYEHLQGQVKSETVKLAGQLTGQDVQVVNAGTQGAAPGAPPAVAAVVNNPKTSIAIAIGVAVVAWFLIGGKK